LKIVAVNGSLVADGNVKALLDYALAGFDGKPRFETKLFEISRMTVGPCKHCNWCFKKQAPGRYCAQDDGMTEVYPELIESAGLLIATPVHFGRLSGATAHFIDRFRVFVHGNITAGAMRNKVGGALAVAWFRNAGLEQTLMTINTAYHSLSMVVAAPDLGVHGAAAFSSVHGTGETRKGDRLLVKSDEYGMASARSVALRVGELATLIEAGKRAQED
jgi:multimeric flavodoxin WrbA